MNRRAFTLLELLVVMAIIAVLIGLFLPAVLRVRAAVARTACANNLRQVGLAFHNYQGQRGRLPAGINGKDAGWSYFMSWQAELLPYLEQQALADSLQSGASHHIPFAPPPSDLRAVVRVYQCPSDSSGDSPRRLLYGGGPDAGLVSYLGVNGTNRFRNDGVLFAQSRVRLSDITDGASNTLMAGERPPYPDIGWGTSNLCIWCLETSGAGGCVLGVRESSNGLHPSPTCGKRVYRFGPGTEDDPCDAAHFWSNHGGGANFLFCDGAVRFLSYSADDIMPALATRAGRERVTVPE